MKTLQESLFDDDLVKKDVFEDILDRLDPKKYSLDETINSLDQLWNMADRHYMSLNEQHRNKIYEIIKKTSDWVLIAVDLSRKPHDYQIMWIKPDHTETKIDTYILTWKGEWYSDTRYYSKPINTRESIDALLTSCCAFDRDWIMIITDKKQVNAIKKRILKLAI